jgi:3-oxoacyl-[acyl-carrier protein] reductase
MKSPFFGNREKNMQPELKNKIALVTGACRGIGKATAIELGKAGATVIGADIDAEKAAQIDLFLKEHNLTGQGIILDVTSQNSIDEALALIKNQYGAPEILVNNAGINRDNLVLRMKNEEWNSVIETDLNAVFKISQACLRDMVKARSGRIINISSIVGVNGNAGQSNYAAAKAGVIAFSKSLAREVATRGITVNAIAPGYIETPMTQKLTAEQKQAILNNIPLQRVGLPEDIAYAVVFLASARANYITGTTLHINGGMYMA